MPLPLTLANMEEAALGAADYAWRTVYGPIHARWLAANEAGALARGIAQLRASSMVVGASGLGLTLVVPLAVWVGVWVAMGAGYAEAKSLVKKEEWESGFSRGFVMRLLGWDWSHAVSRFFRFSAGQINPFDESLSYVGANAYNEGLRAGYVHASSFNKKIQTAFLERIKKLSPSVRAGKSWTRVDQIDYVTYLAAYGRAHNVFVSAE